jgi:predicted DNA-binding protein (UPF0251 family)
MKKRDKRGVRSPIRKATQNQNSRRVKGKAPRTADQYNAKPLRFKDAYERTIRVISKMKSEKLTLTQAAKDVGVSRDTVIRWAGSALKKDASGRYTAKKRDQLLRMMKVPTETGYEVVGVKGSRNASVLGQYWAALHKYWTTGDASGLDKFRGREIRDASGNKIPFNTNLRQLKDLGRSGEIRFETIYGDSH